jgi:hypothetical protein
MVSQQRNGSKPAPGMNVPDMFIKKEEEELKVKSLTGYTYISSSFDEYPLIIMFNGEM